MLVLDEDGLAFLRALPEGPAAMPENLKRPRRSSPGEISPTQRLAVEAKAKNGEAA
jgi:hypothetical protein